MSTIYIDIYSKCENSLKFLNQPTCWTSKTLTHGIMLCDKKWQSVMILLICWGCFVLHDEGDINLKSKIQNIIQIWNLFYLSRKFLPQDEEDEGDVPRNGRYTLKSVKKIDHYSRYNKKLFQVHLLKTRTTLPYIWKQEDSLKLKQLFYLRRIFAGTYITFALYFFIRYHAIEGALSIDFVEWKSYKDEKSLHCEHETVKPQSP